MNFLDFLTRYWQEIVFIVVSITTFFINLLMIIKSKALNSKAFLAVVLKIPNLIRDCEVKHFADSSDKLNYVLSEALKLMVIESNKSYSYCLSNYGNQLESIIEDVLNTPQKKGTYES